VVQNIQRVDRHFTYIFNHWIVYIHIYLLTYVCPEVDCAARPFIMILMVIGELSGDAEVERLAAKRGVAMNGGFLLFFFSLIIIAHTNTHTHKHTHTHTYTYTHKTHIHTHSHAYMYLYIYLFNLCHTHKCTDEYNHVCTHMHAHTHMRTHTYAPQGRI